MRKSLEDIKHMVTDRKYPGLPDELREFNYYIADSGHCIMAIPETLLPEAEANGDLIMFECPIPVKYVLDKGYRKYGNHIVVNVGYSNVLGCDIDEKYYEF